MKTSLIVFSIMASSAMMAFSQGTVVYNNVAGATRAPILITPAFPNTQLQGQPTATVALSTPNGTTDYGAGATAASGTSFTAELWAGASAGSVTAVTGSQSPLRTGTFAGYFTQIASLEIPQIQPGGSGTLQIRAWDNKGGTVTTWASAIAGNGLRGQSAPFVNTTGNSTVTPALAPSSLNIAAFNLFTQVPEPSVIALGALGLGALLLRRRKA